MKHYNITGDFIFLDLIKDGTYKKFKISLSNDFYVHVYDYNLIDLVDNITMNKYTCLIDEYGLKTIIFRKHIVKITQVN